MIPESFYQIPNYESIVTITSSSLKGTHVKNLWNIYLFITSEGKLLIPFESYSTTEEDLGFNNQVKLSIRNAEIENEQNNNLPGIGYIVHGTGRFLSAGAEFEMIRIKYPRAISVMEVVIKKCTQMLQ